MMLVSPLTAKSPLAELIDAYLSSGHRPRQRKQATGDRWRLVYRQIMLRLRKALGRLPIVADLSAETFSRLNEAARFRRQHVHWQRSGQRPVTQIEKAFLALWRYAEDVGLATGAPRRQRHSGHHPQPRRHRHFARSGIDRILDSYLLTREVAPETIDGYRRNVSALKSWHGGSIAEEEFTHDLVNRFLLAKQEECRSSSYRRGLRATFRALLNHVGRVGKLRNVKWTPLEPLSWSPEEVQRLINAAPNRHWKTLIELAYYTGLNQKDLERVERRHIVDGVLRWRRSKTAKLVMVRLPQPLIDRLPPRGPVVVRKCSKEYFRQQFNRIVQQAGLKGPFKTLRKSSGTLVESLYPGAGHLHLGNTRAVFELHYLHPERGLTPLSPPELPRLTE